jgi:hypothetical protein
MNLEDNIQNCNDINEMYRVHEITYLLTLSNYGLCRFIWGWLTYYFVLVDEFK